MIVYELVCANSHRFEGWFASSAEFGRQHDELLLSCPICGNSNVERVPHASYVGKGASEKTGQARPARSAKHYANLASELLPRLIDTILENTEDVGNAFPEEARKVHYREAPERHIRGTASSKEVEALRDEGIDVVALPVPPHRQGKTH